MSSNVYDLLILLHFVDRNLPLLLQPRRILLLSDNNLILVGLILSLIFASQLIGRPLIESILENGKKRKLLVRLIFASLFFNFLSLFDSLSLFFTSRILHNAVTFTEIAIQGVADENVKKDETSSFIRRLQYIAMLTSITIPVLSGLLFDISGHHIIYVVNCLINISMLAIVRTWIPDDPEVKKNAQKVPKPLIFLLGPTKLIENLKNVQFEKYKTLLIAQFCVTAFIMFSLMNMSIMLGTAYNLKLIQIGFAFLCFMAATFAGHVWNSEFMSEKMPRFSLQKTFVTTFSVIFSIPFITISAVVYVITIVSAILISTIIDKTIADTIINSEVSESEKRVTLLGLKNVATLARMVSPLVNITAIAVSGTKAALVITPLIPLVGGIYISRKTVIVDSIKKSK